ncbi:MAG: serine/threonine protein kinase [Deltaproteobacteria bacterium]|nr:serine/threonine protein kinase [Deltaproteobacteria bacterium]
MAEERNRKRAGDKLLDTGSPENPLPFGDYEIVGKIGCGGMANVYHGRSPANPLSRLAIKCMRPKLASEDRFVEMFSRETKLALLLQHPGIVRTFDAGEACERLYIAMEYIPGQDLAALLRRSQETGRRLPVPHALHIIAGVARALDYAHNLLGPTGRPLNIVNRDVSPANIRISYDGGVKLLDFGIAQAAVQVSSEIGVLKGKFAYMSPEQIRGLPVDARSDVFSLGSVAHEILTGERLFRGESEFALMEKVRGAPLRPPSAFDKRVPEDVDAVVMGMLERNAKGRIAEAGQVADQLESILVRYHFQMVELGRYMRQLYPEDYRQEQQLQEVLGAADPVDVHEGVAVSEAERPAKTRRRRKSSSASAARHRDEMRKRTLIFASVVIALAAAIMMVAVFI